MADDRAGLGGYDTLARYPWMRLLRTFLVAVDPFKLLVAAAGILVASIGWWLISVLFSAAWSAPRELDYTTISPEAIAEFPEETREENRLRLEAEGRRQYQIERERYLWKMSLAGPEGYVDAAGNPTEDGMPAPGGAFLPAGTFRHMPWTEKRGPNPYYLGSKAVTGTPEERRDTLADFYQYSAPNLVEPLIKYLRPIVYLSHPKAGFGARIYLCSIILWTLLVWAFFGGIITRMAVLQFAGKEAGGLKEAVKFVSTRFGSYFLSPMVPLGIIAVVIIGSVVFGLVHMIPILGDLVDGLFWFIPLGFGFVMALLLAGLIGYPLMYPTLSAEGSDTFDALSRSYNYVYESPWSYLWYAFISIVYGAVVVFFVVLMASLTVYLGKWAVGGDAVPRVVRPEQGPLAGVPVHLLADLVRLARTAHGRLAGGLRLRDGRVQGARRRRQVSRRLFVVQPRLGRHGRLLDDAVLHADARLRLLVLLVPVVVDLPAHAQEGR